MFYKIIASIKPILGKNEILTEIRWRAKNKPVPPPSFIKQRIIKKYAKNFSVKTFVETGTCTGATTMSAKDTFDVLYTIELNTALFKKAKERFSTYPKISIFHGDSAEVLPSILDEVNNAALFWLDGHYSGGDTSKGDVNTPILKELELILNHKIKNHVILIDDARLFIGKDDYPTIDELKSFIKKINPKLNIEIQNDIIRIVDLSVNKN